MSTATTPIHACLIVDDFPACPIFQTRDQGRALGFEIKESAYAAGWQEMDRMKLMPVHEAHAFADSCDQFDIRGKFTCLPFPAGFGRLDQSVRGYSAAELQEILSVVRTRIAPRFDITPETLSHTLACDPDSGAMFPHAETAWLSFLARNNRVEELAAYVAKGFRILTNVGLQPRGITMGGMPDLSGIAAGQSLTAGFHRAALAKAQLLVEQQFNPAAPHTFMYSGAEPATDASKDRRYPELLHTDPATGKKVYELFSRVDPVWFLFRGAGDPAAAIDACITPDLEHGSLVEDANAGRAVVITVHSFTLNSNMTGVGLRCVREILRRLNERYGQRLHWTKASDLCTLAPSA